MKAARKRDLERPVSYWLGDDDVYRPTALGGSSAHALDSNAADTQKGLYMPDGTFRPLRTRPPMGFPKAAPA